MDTRYRRILAGILGIWALALASHARAAVWENQAQWTAEWEQKYRAWVLANWDKDFFNRPGPFQNLKVDCADAVYTMRFAFSAQHGLPFVITDGTGGTKLLSNDMTRWDALAPDKRKRAFLSYLYGIVSTHSLPNDTYPIAVSRETLASGIVLRTDEKSHHSWTIKYFSDTGVPFLVYSSRPAKTTLLTRFEYPTTGFTFPNGLTAETKAGFMAFRHPEDLRKPVWDVPGYSLEQYSLPIAKWAKTLQARLKVVDETPDQETQRMLDSVCKSAQERVTAVKEALAFMIKIGDRCMNATEFDDYSTPSRDARLRGALEELATLDQNHSTQHVVLSAAIQANVDDLLRGTGAEAFCPLKISAKRTLTLHDVYEAFRADRVSWNPHDPLEIRWGLEKGPSAHAAACPVY
jgi:hypothetical protein